MACDQCNPLYGDVVTGRCDNTQDDMFDDHQPIRAAKEAAKNFVRRMQARFDQVGFVEYDTAAFIARELNCILTPARGQDRMPEGPLGVWDDAAWQWCYDHQLTPDGQYDPSGDWRPSDDVTHGSIIGAIESMRASGQTNIADGIQLGILTLTTATGHYGRPNAAKFMVLMTDGQANRYPNDECHAEDLWPDNSGDAYQVRARDCVVYYANRARNSGISIFTIGLGINADHELLQDVADRTGGEYFFAPKAKDLDRIMQEIADKIFLRLVE